MGSFSIKWGGSKKEIKRPENLDRKRPTRVGLNDRINKQAFLQTRKDMQDFSNAVNRAKSETHPNRAELMDVYRDISLDGHLTGIVESIKRKIKGREYHIINQDKTVDKELTAKFEQKWFGDLLDLAVDAYFYGYSLVGLGDIKDDVFEWVENIDREYIVPELHAVKQHKYDVVNEDSIFFDKPPYKHWYLLFGRATKDLGIYHKVAPHCIGKKNLLLQAWDNAELYGMPIRVIKTNTADEERRKWAEKAIEQMGSAAAGVIDEDDELELHERDEGDSYKTFLEPYYTSNQEISKAIAGQTMAFSEGSSRAQAEVHERLFTGIVTSFAVDISHDINKELLPRMVFLIGEMYAGKSFEWVEQEPVNILEKVDMITKLAHDGFVFEEGYVEEYTGIKAEQAINSGLKEKEDIQEKYTEIINLYGTDNKSDI